MTVVRSFPRISSLVIEIGTSTRFSDTMGQTFAGREIEKSLTRSEECIPSALLPRLTMLIAADRETRISPPPISHRESSSATTPFLRIAFPLSVIPHTLI